MKRITKLSCLLFISLLIASCSSDDDDSGNAGFSNTIGYDGDEIDVTEAYIVDYGAEEGYYNYDYTLEGTSSDEISFEFYAELFSIGTESFVAGTFEFYDYNSDEELPDFYYSDSSLEFDGSYLDVVDGDIIVSGNGTTYSISGILTLEDGEVVEINYSGEFSIEIDE
ncbi:MULTISPECIES: hypothetical protein [unclassified Algibacter]|uniref:hypothetical protein n=1 Tax=unclassified Algibacter TaxID=2615009 RepID=UPI00131C6CDE|nr:MULTISPECIES: hypothetical protein [unclassified Algibacter]MCL5128939.1 hypothetical protein [Algibacter sp. L4_22]